jgi:hypothetical protein
MRELIKGWLGEKMTTFGMWLKLEQEVYRRVHNVILPARNGTTQIDHVVVSIYGLFVIETKNMEGWIFGSAQQETCTQQFFKKKVDPCLHLKSRKDFSLEIFEHARSHNTENASELTVSAQTYSEPLPSEQSIMGRQVTVQETPVILPASKWPWRHFGHSVAARRLLISRSAADLQLEQTRRSLFSSMRLIARQPQQRNSVSLPPYLRNAVMYSSGVGECP